MEKIDIKYSLKNIPNPSQKQYFTSFMGKLSKFINNIRWKVLFFEKEETEDETNTQNNFGFKTEKTPPQPKSLIKFENDLYSLAKTIKFKTKHTKFQNEMKKDMNIIKNSKYLLIKADKTSNIYKIKPEKYYEMLQNNISTAYKKDRQNTKQKINDEAVIIAENLGLEKRITTMPEPQSFLSIKDHKENFPDVIKCRLINPAKTEIGKISKQYLENINKTVKEKTKVKQWRNTQEVLDWFNQMENKKDKEFINMDIVDFYPSITEKTLNKSLNFAKKHTDISQEKLKTIKHARQTILFDNNNETWTKRENSKFDVSMGSNDSAEICEIVGLYLLNEIRNKIKEIEFGLYRDDGLGTYSKLMTGPERSKLEKNMRKIFKDNGFKITIKTGIKQVAFLDVNLNLTTEQHKPYRKENDIPKYINVQSNHPKNIIKEIPKIINDRLSAISSNKEIFNKEKNIYQEKLKEAGYNEELKYLKPKAKKNKRKRNIIWFNPPYNQNVDNDIGRQFLNVIDGNFPKTNKLSKIINRKLVKLSYSCTQNMERIIKGHNNEIINKNNNIDREGCSCRTQRCPLNGECLTKNIVYKATVESINTKKEYIGMTSTTFKDRFSNHKQSFNNELYKTQTKLSNYIWAKKEEEIETNIKWEKVTIAKSFIPGNKTCNLCNSEKYQILKSNNLDNLLNQNTEIAHKCPHIRQYTMKEYKKRRLKGKDK